METEAIKRVLDQKKSYKRLLVIVRNAMLLKISKADEDIPQMYQIATWKIPVTKTFSVFEN